MEAVRELGIRSCSRAERGIAWDISLCFLQTDMCRFVSLFSRITEHPRSYNVFHPGTSDPFNSNKGETSQKRFEAILLSGGLHEDFATRKSETIASTSIIAALASHARGQVGAL